MKAFWNGNLCKYSFTMTILRSQLSKTNDMYLLPVSLNKIQQRWLTLKMIMWQTVTGNRKLHLSFLENLGFFFSPSVANLSGYNKYLCLPPCRKLTLISTFQYSCWCVRKLVGKHKTRVKIPEVASLSSKTCWYLLCCGKPAKLFGTQTFLESFVLRLGTDK